MLIADGSGDVSKCEVSPCHNVVYNKNKKGLSIQRFGRGSLQVKVIPGHGADGSRARDALGWTDDILYQWNKMECFESYCHTWTDEVSLLSLKG